MLSKNAMNLLQWLSEPGEDEFGYERELVHEGRIWMAGVRRVSERAAQELIMLCCISTHDLGRYLERWAINGTGRDMLKDPVETTKHIRQLLHGEITE